MQLPLSAARRGLRSRVQLHQSDHAVSLAVHFGVAVVRHGHELVPIALENRPGGRQPIVEAACLDDLHQICDVGAD